MIECHLTYVFFIPDEALNVRLIPLLIWPNQKWKKLRHLSKQPLLWSKRKLCHHYCDLWVVVATISLLFLFDHRRWSILSLSLSLSLSLFLSLSLLCILFRMSPSKQVPIEDIPVSSLKELIADFFAQRRGAGTAVKTEPASSSSPHSPHLQQPAQVTQCTPAKPSFG